MIASDHAPHHADEKARGMTPRARPFGIVGLETTLGARARARARRRRSRSRRRSARSRSGRRRVLGIAGGQLGAGERRRRDADRSRAPLDGRPGGVSLAQPQHAVRRPRAARRARSAVCLGGRVVDGESRREVHDDEHARAPRRRARRRTPGASSPSPTARSSAARPSAPTARSAARSSSTPP